jgi:hypothetical protein
MGFCPGASLSVVAKCETGLLAGNAPEDIAGDFAIVGGRARNRSMGNAGRLRVGAGSSVAALSHGTLRV